MLIYKNQVNNMATYRCPKERKEIIELWRNTYGMKKFEQCAIQIRPDLKRKIL
jgi:hypothetical protein